MRRLLVAATLVLAAAAAFADDVVVLTNGREAHGKIVEETDAGVKLDVGGGKMFYPRKLIKEVRHGAPDVKPAAAPEPSTPAESRDEYSLLYDDGKRVGAPAYGVARTCGGQVATP